MPQVSIWKIFWEFNRLSLLGFGGVLSIAYQSIVKRSKWLNDKEFAEMFGISKVLPGGNITNLSAMLGFRFAKIKGAIAALLGLLFIPMILLLLLAEIYAKFSHIAYVARAITGVAAVAAGLMIATAVKLALKQPQKLGIIIFSIIKYFYQN